MLILAMSFSGSVVFLIILLCAVFGKNRLSSTWVYHMLRLDLIFFCLPLPKYSSGYHYRVTQALGIQKQWKTIDFALENVIGIEQGGRLHISFRTYVFYIWLVWMCGVLAFTLYNMRKYRYLKVLRTCPQIKQSNYLELFDSIKKQLGINKGVELLCDVGTGTALTIGVFRQYVIVPEEGLTDEELYFIFKHELIHVKRKDVGWRYLTLFVLLMHWFNPVVYLFVFAMTIFSEQSCDEMVVKDLDHAGGRRYIDSLLNTTFQEKKHNSHYGAYFNMGMKKMEWRLKNMVRQSKGKRIKRAAGVLLGVTILFGGSLTVCAYEDTRVIKDVEQSFMEDSEERQSQWDFVKKESTQAADDEALEFSEFEAEDGTCYDLSEMQNGGMERAGCIHAFESGYLKNHQKYADGSCDTVYYNADMCYKCGYIILKGYSHTETSTKCIH